MIKKIIFTEYLCDHCECVFQSPLLVQQHQKKSCTGVKNKKQDEREERKRLAYQEFRSANRKKCKDCGTDMFFVEMFEIKWIKGNKCMTCQEEEHILQKIEEKEVCCREHYVKKYH